MMIGPDRGQYGVEVLVEGALRLYPRGDGDTLILEFADLASVMMFTGDAAEAACHFHDRHVR